MIVVSDSSPLHYLILMEQVQLLPTPDRERCEACVQVTSAKILDLSLGIR